MTSSYTVEVHVPASPTLQFANMLFFLVHSLAERAQFPGHWRVVITLGHDGPLGPDSPEFAWARNFPVEFWRADPALWAQFSEDAARLGIPNYVHNATILSQLNRVHDADIVVYMDADTVVVRPFLDLIETVRATGALAAKPAWQPPPIDLDGIIAKADLRYDGPLIEYSGYGWSFLEPRHAPPYLNGGFIVCARNAAEVQRRRLVKDFGIVSKAYPGHFVWQISGCLTIIREGLQVHTLDERFNLGIGEALPSLLPGDLGRAQDALGWEQVNDRRVIHYCTPTRHFRRNRTMGDNRELLAFCTACDLDFGENLLREAFAPYLEAWGSLLATPGEGAG